MERHSLRQEHLKRHKIFSKLKRRRAYAAIYYTSRPNWILIFHLIREKCVYSSFAMT